MRKLALVMIAIAGLAWAAPSSARPEPVAAAQPPEHLRFTASPARAGESVTLGFTLGTGAPWSSGHFGIDLPGAVWNGRRFPTCSLKRLSRDRSAKRCPRRSRVGTGRAMFVHGAPQLRIEERFRVTAVNSGSALHMIWKGSPVTGSPNGRTLIWRSRIGELGEVTEWTAMDFVEIIGGVTATLEHFELEVGATSRGQGIFEIPRCRNGRWRATAVLHYHDILFEDRGIGRASDSVRCRV
jgi:hypothetical protein